MESAPSKIGRYIFHTQVVKVEEKFNRIHESGVGPTTIFKNVSKGWYIYLKGSYEGLHLGYSKPDLSHADHVRITIEKVSPNDKS